MKLTDFMVKEAIVPDLKATNREGVIRELLGALAQAGAIKAGDVEAIGKVVLEREKQGSTGFGRGVAVPHARHPAVSRRVATIGHSAAGVDFAALDQAPVYSIVLLLSPTTNPDDHLQAMENIFRNLQQEMFRRFLRRASTRAEIIDLIEEADQTGLAR